MDDINALRAAVGRAPASAPAWTELARALRRALQLAQALECIERALALQPDLAEAWFNYGAILVAQGKIKPGITAYRKTLELRAEYPEAWSNLGLALGSEGSFHDEVAAHRKALECNPRLAPVWTNLGNALGRLGQAGEALDAYRQAVDLDPLSAYAWSNLGDALREAGRLEEAEHACAKSVELDSNAAEVWANLGALKLARGDTPAAAAALQRALEIAPALAAAWGSLGIAYLRLRRIDDAIAAARRATEIAPAESLWWFNFGQALAAGIHLDEAVAAMQKAVALKPSHAGIRAELGYLLRQTCDWSELAEHEARLGSGAEAMPFGQEEMPLANITRSEDEACNLAIAGRWAQRLSTNWKPRFDLSRQHPAGGGRRIAIGYLSSDIHNHATAHLMRGVFARHDHALFKIHTYSYGVDDQSRYRQDIEKASAVFRNIRDVSSAEAAAMIYDDGVDILVDLKGWTEGTRLEICALRPAPLQLTYLGFPGSSGARFFDYVVADHTVVPPSSQRYYREKLIYLPHCYQATDNTQPIADGPLSRLEHRLPENAVVYCSFNRPLKFDAATFGAWMQILQRVPSAVLWLLEGNRWAMENLKRFAAASGVPAEKLIFAPAVDKPSHLRRLQLADVVLDTGYYNGHTTTSDALWAGVPVVTILGRHFASRVSASCLKAVGMEQLVTKDIGDYIELSVRLGGDRQFLNSTKAMLHANKTAWPLFDTGRFTRNLEQAYRTAWNAHLAGSPPESFSVTEN